MMQIPRQQNFVALFFTLTIVLRPRHVHSTDVGNLFLGNTRQISRSTAINTPTEDVISQHPQFENITVPDYADPKNQIDSNECYSVIDFSDTNSDGKVNETEFVNLMNVLTNQTYGWTNRLELPIIVQFSFLFASCKCSQYPHVGQNNSNCCVDELYISSSGTDPKETPTAQEIAYLDEVCPVLGFSQREALKITPSPTFVPTSSPTGSFDGCPATLSTSTNAVGDGFGLMFHIRTSESAAALVGSGVLLTSLSFFSNSEQPLTYQLYNLTTPEGGTLPTRVSDGSWTQVSAGTTTPPADGEDFVTIPEVLDLELQPNEVQSLYLSLETRDVGHSIGFLGFPHLVSATDDTLEILQGTAVIAQGNPSDDDGYAEDRTFVGSLSYRVMGKPCKTSSPTATVTAGPTAAPTSVPTKITAAPTGVPTGVTDSPTTVPPTSGPTTKNTGSPTLVPTESHAPTQRNTTSNPTARQTQSPTAITTTPTVAPTKSPTAPTETPTYVTASPTTKPTTTSTKPTLSTTNVPTASHGPTVSPTTSPSTFPTKSLSDIVTDDEEIEVGFNISNSAGLTASVIQSSSTIVRDLMEAVDVVMELIVDGDGGGGDGSGGRGRHLGKMRRLGDKGWARVHRRRLPFTYSKGENPPQLTDIIDIVCPGYNSTDDENAPNCQTVSVIVTVRIENDTRERARDLVLVGIANATLDDASTGEGGILQQSLEDIDEDTPLLIGLGASPPPSPTPVPTPAPTPAPNSIPRASAPDDGGDDDNGGLSAGIIAGIIASSVVVVGGLVGLFVVGRRRKRHGNGLGTKQSPNSPDRDDLLTGGSGYKFSSRSLSGTDADDNEDILDAGSILGSSPQYDRNSEKDYEMGVLGSVSSDHSKGDSFVTASGMGDSGSLAESSSVAGSSGWSSSAGESSAVTGGSRASDMMFGKTGSGRQVTPHLESEAGHDGDVIAAAAVGGAAVGAAAASRRKEPLSPTAEDGGEDEDDDDSGTYEDTDGGTYHTTGDGSTLGTDARFELDRAIEAQDWAAVGATAAMLATVNDDSRSGISGLSRSSRGSGLTSRSSRSETLETTSIDAEKAAELEALVEAGDWDGVVLAAGKLEAATENDRSRERGYDGEASQTITDNEEDETLTTYDDDMYSRTDDEDDEEMSESGAEHSPQYESSVSATPDEIEKRNEVKAEVEALVRVVVPDEIDNVDVMMLQFKGREDELVQTLRTMQERSVTQRARAAVHKSTKRAARNQDSDSTLNTNLEASLSSLPSSSTKTSSTGTGSRPLTAGFKATGLETTQEQPAPQSAVATAGQEAAHDSLMSLGSEFSDPQFNATPSSGMSKVSSGITKMSSVSTTGGGGGPFSSSRGLAIGPDLPKMLVPDSSMTPRAPANVPQAGAGGSDGKFDYNDSGSFSKSSGTQ